MDLLPLQLSEDSEARASSDTSFAGFDLVRVFAALGVVMLHACVPYLKNPMPGLTWSVADRSSSTADALFWGIEVFVMPVFLVLAGFLAWRTIARRGPKKLVSSRAKRLLVPLLFALVVVLPLDLYVWMLSWVGEGLIAPVKLRSLKIEGPLAENLWGTSHLWFLQYLFLYVVVFALAYAGWSKTIGLRNRNPIAWSVAVVAFLTGVVMIAFRPEVVWGFQHAFAPVPSKWIYSGTFFVGGVLLAVHDPKLIHLQKRGWRIMLPAVVMLVATVWLGRSVLSSGGNQSAVPLAFLTTASAWLITLGLIGLATRYITNVSVPIQYLAAASFWIYLVHHPILGLVHTDLKLLFPNLAPLSKVLIAFTASTCFSLLLYESFVRTTGFGRWLGFAWELAEQSDARGPETKEQVSEAVAA